MLYRKTKHDKIPKCGGLLCKGDDPFRFVYVFASKFHPVVIMDNLKPEDEGYEEYAEHRLFQTIKCPLLKCMTIKEISDANTIATLFPGE